MRKTLLYTTSALLLAFTACEPRSGNSEETVSEDLHVKHTNQADMSREDHLKMVKAENVTQFSSVDQQAQATLSMLTGQYLQLKEALVTSDAQLAANAAAALQQSLNAWDGSDLPQEQQDFYKERSSAMQENLSQIVEQKDLIKQRDHFARLSKHVAELAMAFETNKGGLFYQFCPMAFDNKGAYWLSDSKEIRNPFYPEEMLTCGRVAKEL